MFTGLIEQLGTVEGITRRQDGLSLRIACALHPYELGESIAVNGTCLTVKSFAREHFDADASLETLDKTNLGDLAEGDRVHLERALALGDRLGGHLVTGHVDGVGTLISRTPDGDYLRTTFEVPRRLAPFLAPKGSMTVNGVSLTVNSVKGPRFDVMLVPYTLDHTTFGEMLIGCRVNLEVDILAKYVASLMGKPGVDGSGPE
ncbi:MAG TPA: riboflavin synthase [Polyangiales bacterium]|jgi:riboflavin synthase|nr:riboflavin synthase [Polyangiales bacterium]